MSTRSRLITLAALGAAAVVPGSAHAATSCYYSSFAHSVTVTMFATGDAAKIGRAGDTITFDGNPCGSATIGNTDALVWNDQSGGGTAAVLDLSGGAFPPTAAVTYYAGSGDDTFEVFGTPQDDSFRIGTAGLYSYVNLDVATEPVFADAEVELRSVETVDINGGEGADVIDATAHSETGGAAFGGTLYEEGALGNDQLTSGSGPAELSGGAGDDSLAVGGVGQTTIKPGAGDDSVVGELLANDVVDYGDAPAGVDVDLSRKDRQNTGGAGNDQLSGFRKLTGSPYADVLAGTEGADTIKGAGGDDVIIGRNGDDQLIGGAGANIASYAEPSPGAASGVTVSLPSQGVAQDTGTEGKDTLSGMSGLIGSPFGDMLTGDAAANRIEGGGGADTIDAGDGPDTVLLRDGVSDHADCGAGTDAVQSDVAGLDVLTGCEQADFAPFADPPAPGGGSGDVPAGPGGSDTALTFRFTAKARQRLGRHGVIKGSLSCPDEACTGVVSSKPAVKRRSLALAPGAVKTVKLRLTTRSLRRARWALRHGSRLSLKLTAVAHDAAGNARTVTRTIKLRA